MTALIEWWTANGVAAVAAVVALVLAAEGVVRALEAVVDSLLFLAKLTATKADDAALTVAKGRLHKAAEAIASLKSQVQRFALPRAKS